MQDFASFLVWRGFPRAGIFMKSHTIMHPIHNPEQLTLY
jgi:hypothetical protein